MPKILLSEEQVAKLVLANNQLFEIEKRLAKSLPLYVVDFDQDGTFDLEFQGNV